VLLADAHPELIHETPLDLFEQIFDYDSFESLKHQFERYAHRDNNTPSFSTSDDEIRKYFGIILLSGYHCLPSERDYWSTADDLGMVKVKGCGYELRETANVGNFWNMIAPYGRIPC